MIHAYLTNLKVSNTNKSFENGRGKKRLLLVAGSGGDGTGSDLGGAQRDFGESWELEMTTAAANTARADSTDQMRDVSGDLLVSYSLAFTQSIWISAACNFNVQEGDMLPYKEERTALAQEFASDVRRMRECLQVENYRPVTDDELVYAWADYSDGLCAVWHGLPEDDVMLLNILCKHLPQTSTDNTTSFMWHARIVDAGDGTGDGILELPDALMAQLRWEIDDKLDISLNEASDIVLRKSE